MMKIRVKDRALFSDIEKGTVFSFLDGSLCYLKIEKFQTYNALCLDSCSLTSIDDNTYVTPYYNSELIVK